MSETDLQLLARYSQGNAEEAFGEIVRRHLDLVFSAALRQVRSPQLAEEVAQSVFADLARQATRLAPGTVVTAWLYAVTRRSAIDVVRREVRRQLREQIAVQLDAMNANENEVQWTQVAPLLDEAMLGLEEADRAAVLLRYFENKSFREVGETLGTNEEAARKRVARAVERLRGFFTKRGVSVSAGGLVSVVSANAVGAAPAGLVPVISNSASLAGVSAAATAVKVGAAVKGTAAFGSVGSMFAVLGGAVLTSKVLADETKSPRERQFVLRMMGIRLVFLLLVLGTYYGVNKLDFAHEVIGRDGVNAAFLFLVSAVGTVSFDYMRRMQRQIQSEDGTLTEGEWHLPRKETEELALREGKESRWNFRRNAAWIIVSGLMICAMAASLALWRQAPIKAVALAALLLGTLFWIFRLWSRMPRFKRPGVRGLINGCAITLIFFDVQQYRAGWGAGNGTSLMAIVMFNLVVMLVYSGFIGILVGNRREDFSATS